LPALASLSTGPDFWQRVLKKNVAHLIKNLGASFKKLWRTAAEG